jgi:hypothetical protein
MEPDIPSDGSHTPDASVPAEETSTVSEAAETSREAVEAGEQTLNSEPAAPPSPPSADSSAVVPPPVLRTPKPVSLEEFRARVTEGKRRKLEHKLERLAALAREKKVLKNDDIQLLLRVSDPTASRYARILISRGILRAVGKTKGLHYVVVE